MIGIRVHFWIAACLLVFCWAAGLACWKRNGTAHPKMDAIAWITAADMLMAGDSTAAIYSSRTERITIEIDRAPGRLLAGPDELILTRVLPGAALAERARRLGYQGSDPPAFVYPPGAALLAIPLSWLGWQGATFVIDTLGLCILGMVTALILARLGSTTRTSMTWLAALLAVFTLSHPLGFSLYLGQLTPALAAGWLVLWLPRTRGGSIVCGFLVGLLGVLKVFPLVLLLWFVVCRRWLSLTAALVFFVGGCMALGSDAFSAWLAAARQMSAPARVWTDNQSLSAVLHRFVYPLDLVRDWVIITPAPAQGLSTGAGLLMLCLWAWCAMRRARAISRPDELRLFGALWILPVSLGALFWSHYIVLVFPAVVVALAGPRRGTASWFAVAIAGLLLASDANAWTALMPFIETAVGIESAAFIMRILVSLPAMAMVALFLVLLKPTGKEASAEPGCLVEAPEDGASTPSGQHQEG